MTSEGLGLAGAERPEPVAAVGSAHTTLVADLPTTTTPHVTNGNVRTVDQPVANAVALTLLPAPVD